MHALRVIYIIWLREFKAFMREKGRIIGMIGQPLLYLLIVGQGIASGMSLNRAAGFDYLKYIYPGILGMSVLFTSVFSALSIIWDREFGFLKEVLVAPVPRWSVAMGKICGGATIAMMQSAILIALAPFVGVKLSVLVVLELLLLCFLISFAVTSLGVLIAARMRSMQGFQMLMNFLIMPIYFLSGAMFPVASAPRWMQVLMTIDPLTYGVDALRNVIYSETTAEVGGSAISLVDMARESGLIRWSLGMDLGLCILVAGLLAVVASYVFSTAD
ncbi:MAG TPA: ABC transporter permease [Gemmataceae bacterium]|jgi:ABC-2 type transport system permease protein|nr:ABC transporter permease [Gemmataceae bacterium]